jgi:hypothetical protein
VSQIDKPPRFAYFHPLYLISLPERLLRALVAGAGGLVYEATLLLLPGWLRRSRLYQATVYRLLRLLIELVGDVRGVLPPDSMAVNELVVRKAVGNVIELAGFAALGWSPLWLLAAASDLTGGTRAYLNAFVSELQKQGLLIDAARIDSVDDLLGVLEGSSSVMADMVDVPPVNVQDLSNSWQALQQNARSLPDAGQLMALFNHMQQVASQQGRSLASLSSLIATGALRAGVQLGSVHIFDYYQNALSSINTEGWAAYAQRIARPYAASARGHFDPARQTYTGKIFSRLRK